MEKPVITKTLKLIAVAGLLAGTSACNSATLSTVYEGTHKDLSYKSSQAYGIGNRIFKPANFNGGAVLFLPSCTGVQHFNSTDIKRNWINPLLEQGYVVAVTDYNEGRGASRPWNCGKNKHLSHDRLIRDVYNGVQALAEVPGVNKNQIFTIGTSLGGQIGAAAIDGHVIDKAEKQGLATPRAHVSLYAGCAYPSQTYLDSSIKRPVLWMSGSDDVEVGEGCSSWLYSSITKKLPESKFIEYNATHCWDCQQLNGFSKNTYYGHQVYTYNEDVTAKSQDETFKFIDRFMK